MDGIAWFFFIYNQGKDCQAIKTQFPQTPEGMYQVQPDTRKLWVYCDMTSFDGAWTMCYSTNDTVDLTTEVTYNVSLPYGTNGYRTDCNDIQVKSPILKILQYLNSIMSLCK